MSRWFAEIVEQPGTQTGRLLAVGHHGLESAIIRFFAPVHGVEREMQPRRIALFAPEAPFLIAPYPTLFKKSQEGDVKLLVRQIRANLPQRFRRRPRGGNGGKHREDLLARRISIANEKMCQGNVLPAEKSDATGGRSVSPGAPRLLVIGFQWSGMLVVDDGAHVRLVDPHAKSDGGHGNRLLA